MPVEPWDESGRVWEEEHGLLDAEQVARCDLGQVVRDQGRGPGRYRAVPKDYESRMTEELKAVLEFGQLKVGDNLSRMKETYAALAVDRRHQHPPGPFTDGPHLGEERSSSGAAPSSLSRDNITKW